MEISDFGCKLCKIRRVIYPALLLFIGVIFVLLLHVQDSYNYPQTSFLSITHPIQAIVKSVTPSVLDPYMDSPIDIIPSDRQVKIHFWENEPSQGLKSFKFNLPKKGYVISYSPYFYFPFFANLGFSQEKRYQKIISVRYPYNEKDKASSWLSFGLAQSNDPAALISCDANSDYMSQASYEKLSERKIGGISFTKITDIAGGMESYAEYASYISKINEMCYEISIEISSDKYPEQNGLKPLYDFKSEIENFLNSFKFES